MLTDTTMVNNGMEYGEIQSMFPGFHHGVISDGVGFGERQFTSDVVVSGATGAIRLQDK